MSWCVQAAGEAVIIPGYAAHATFSITNCDLNSVLFQPRDSIPTHIPFWNSIKWKEDEKTVDSIVLQRIQNLLFAGSSSSSSKTGSKKSTSSSSSSSSSITSQRKRKAPPSKLLTSADPVAPTSTSSSTSKTPTPSLFPLASDPAAVVAAAATATAAVATANAAAVRSFIVDEEMANLTSSSQSSLTASTPGSSSQFHLLYPSSLSSSSRESGSEFGEVGLQQSGGFFGGRPKARRLTAGRPLQAVLKDPVKGGNQRWQRIRESAQTMAKDESAGSYVAVARISQSDNFSCTIFGRGGKPVELTADSPAVVELFKLLSDMRDADIKEAEEAAKKRALMPTDIESLRELITKQVTQTITERLEREIKEKLIKEQAEIARKAAMEEESEQQMTAAGLEDNTNLEDILDDNQ